MAVTTRRGTAALAIAAALLLSGCGAMGPGTGGALDTAGFQQRVDTIDGVNGSFIEVAHPGDPTNTQVITWLLLDDVEVGAVADVVRGTAAEAVHDEVGDHTLAISVIEGDPARYPDRDDAAEQMEPIMKDVAAELGGDLLAGDEVLELSPDDIARLAADATGADDAGTGDAGTDDTGTDDTGTDDADVTGSMTAALAEAVTLADDGTNAQLRGILEAVW